ncbi:MBL fold metallo-hydrolase [Dichotomicrobium thermohalophilum]|uniref:Glyoxylase-like metal-dependent hydrolase (Beta-lactamase superfamily II) n=1 Tax=Dichotomicrobium thermohalophilum TaxID=933063 RepID=A0A397Q8W3_9HYPH|nr:MBL fold metallo-hydrolase [Dichotomicrobium thermohalophilum]RIA56265.1 glyoxylase-like metal-dependent hydrolase (beta-lactamase superfamily II) [Dichotomicrobium thermohalophilum]
MSEQIPFQKEMRFAYGVASPVAPGVRRLVAPNPGPMTDHGTNTYIIGRGNVAVIDPGPESPDHLHALLDELAKTGERVTHILITHTHLDHCAGLPALKQATGALTAGFGSVGLRRTDTLGPGGRSFADGHFTPDIPLRDGEVLSGDDWEITALHTPGHAPDHLCFAYAPAQALFSGDHVMGWNTSVIAPPEGHMGAYLDSLHRLLDYDHTAYFPGHGGWINQPQRLVKAFIMHRRWRENEIIEALQTGAQSVPDITAQVYTGLPEHLERAAQLSVLAHLERLVETGRAETPGSISLEATFSLT